MIPGGASLLSRVGITTAPLVSCVHVTPLRASRALGLRFLAHKFGICLDRLSLLVVAPTATPTSTDKLLVLRPAHVALRLWPSRTPLCAPTVLKPCGWWSNVWWQYFTLPPLLSWHSLTVSGNARSC